MKNEPLRLQVLRGVGEILDKEEHWTKGVSARDQFGHEAPPASPYATCFCILGAVSKSVFDNTKITTDQDVNRSVDVYRSVEHEIMRQIELGYNADPKIGDRYGWIDEFNDSDVTEFSDVRRVIDQSIAAAESDFAASRD